MVDESFELDERLRGKSGEFHVLSMQPTIKLWGCFNLRQRVIGRWSSVIKSWPFLDFQDLSFYDLQEKLSWWIGQWQVDGYSMLHCFIVRLAM